MASDAAMARLQQIVTPQAQAHGVDLVEVALKGSGPRSVLRVVVDRQGGVDLGTCQALSRDLSEALDTADPIGHRYTLEVSSPGTDHPLAGQRAFERVEGRAVLVHRDGGDGRVEQVRGTVSAADTDAVVLDSDGERLRVPYTEIVKATQSLPW